MERGSTFQRKVNVADDLPVVTLVRPAGVTQGHPYVLTVSVEPPQSLTLPLSVANFGRGDTGTLPTQANQSSW